MVENWLRFAPLSNKISLVKTSLHRAFVVSKNWSIFHLEVGKTKELLEKNHYPSYFVDQAIRQYLLSQFSDKKHKGCSNGTSVSYQRYLIMEICQHKLNKK